MTFEEAFCKLCDKYGDDFNWSAINFTNKYYIDEAGKEIRPGHRLYGEIMYSIAKCDSNDDVMFVLHDNSYVIIHLTYCENSDISYPKYSSYQNIEDTMQYIEKQYLDEYRQL